MSLRDEINKELAKAMVWTIKHKQIDVDLPDKLISIFEKRIDALPEWVETYDPDYALGFAAAMIKVKELLK